MHTSPFIPIYPSKMKSGAWFMLMHPLMPHSKAWYITFNVYQELCVYYICIFLHGGMNGVEVIWTIIIQNRVLYMYLSLYIYRYIKYMNGVVFVYLYRYTILGILKVKWQALLWGISGCINMNPAPDFIASIRWTGPREQGCPHKADPVERWW